MKNVLRIIFIGASKGSLSILETLINFSEKKEWQVVGAVTQPDKKTGRKKKFLPNVIKSFVSNHKIRVLTPRKVDEAFQEIKNLNPDIIIISDYAQKIPLKIINLPPYGCLNIHFSLLPKYRGPSPVQFAILNGDKKTGISIFLIDKNFDSGPLLFQKQISIDLNDTTLTLTKKLYQKTSEVLPSFIKKYTTGKIKPFPQKQQNITYTKYFKKEDGKIKWSDPPLEIDRKVRAFYPWPGTWTTWRGKRLKILKTHIEKGKLVIDKLQLEGKKTVGFQDFKRGYPKFTENVLKETTSIALK